MCICFQWPVSQCFITFGQFCVSLWLNESDLKMKWKSFNDLRSANCFTCFQCWNANFSMLFNQSKENEFDSFQRDYKVCSLSLRWGCWPILWENAASSHFLALLEKMWLIRMTPDQSPWQNVSGGLTHFSSQLVHSHVIHMRETHINKQSHSAAGLWIQHHTTVLRNNSIFMYFKATE